MLNCLKVLTFLWKSWHGCEIPGPTWEQSWEMNGSSFCQMLTLTTLGQSKFPGFSITRHPIRVITQHPWPLWDIICDSPESQVFISPCCQLQWLHSIHDQSGKNTGMATFPSTFLISSVYFSSVHLSCVHFMYFSCVHFSSVHFSSAHFMYTFHVYTLCTLFMCTLMYTFHVYTLMYTFHL